MKKRQTTEVLERMLGLIPILSANPGITLDELTSISGAKNKREMRENLHKLMLLGTPPFSPADFIEVFIDENDRVELEFPQGMDRPLALTPGEWSAVQTVIVEELKFQRIGQRGLSYLREILDGMSRAQVSYDFASPFRNKRLVVEEALQDRLQIEFLYKTLSSKEPEVRRVEPWAIFQHRKVTYLIAYCHLRRDARFFHLERMENIEILDVPQESTPSDDLEQMIRESPIFRDDPEGFTAEIAFNPHLRGALESYFKIKDARPLKSKDPGREGWFRAVCKVNEMVWFRATLRSLGPGVMILTPKHLRESYLEELEQVPVPDELS